MRRDNLITGILITITLLLSTIFMAMVSPKSDFGNYRHYSVNGKDIYVITIDEYEYLLTPNGDLIYHREVASGTSISPKEV